MTNTPRSSTILSMTLPNTDSSHALKHLKTVLKDQEMLAEAALIEKNRAHQAWVTAKAKVTASHEKIKQLIEDEKDIVVTEHALLRYIERAYGIDLGEIKERMLPPATISLINQFRSGKIPSDDVRLVVKDRVVITVEPK